MYLQKYVYLNENIMQKKAWYYALTEKLTTKILF